MSNLTSAPDQEILRKFLLGTLPTNEAAEVEKWLNENPDASVVLRDVQAHDTVTDAVGTAPGITSVLPTARTSVQVSPPIPVIPVAEVGGFRLLRELGRGGMGIVYEAQDTKLDRLVAIKLIANEFAAHREARERFLREARAIAKIDHPNVVPVHHVGEDNGQFFLVMPLLKGETLDVRLRREKRLPVSEVFRIGREVAAGLAAAHSVGLVHRDIKPANIWLDADTGRVRILDFGLAKPMEQPAAEAELTSAGAVLGTLHYMSPQQANGEPVDARSDLFSLGAVLFHAATGHRPFDGPSKFAILYAVVNEPPRQMETLAELPERLAALIRELLAKSPDKRPASAAEVIEKIGPEPAEHPRHPVPEPVRRKSPSWWAIAAGLLLAVGAACAATVVVIVRDKDGKIVGQIIVPEGGKVEIVPGQPLPVVSDSDRAAAEWVLSVGGSLGINGEQGTIKAAPELTRDPFRLTRVTLDKNSKVTDAALAVFKGCTHLTELNLYHTGVTDTGLAHFGQCVNLTTLNLEGTQTTDVGLANFKNCKQLAHLYLSETKITDDGLAHFRGRNLSELGLGGTRITDAGLAHFKGITTLTSLFLRSTAVTDAGMANFKDCPNLWQLNLYYTQVGDAGLAHFKACTNLTKVSLSGQRVTDTGLAYLANNAKLRELVLDDTRVTDAAIAALKNYPLLTVLVVTKTKVTAEKFAELAKTLPNCRIEWACGVIDPNSNSDRKAAEWVLSVGGTVQIHDGQNKPVYKLADLPKEPFRLTWVTLVGNQKITDESFAVLRGCRHIQSLNLGGTKVTDAGLTIFKDLPELFELILNNTKITDEGLANFRGCVKLNTLALDHTKITGKGLIHFKDCKALKSLGLSETDVTDESLAVFKGSTKLSSLYLQNTKVGDAGLAHFKDCENLFHINLNGSRVTNTGLIAFLTAHPRLVTLFLNETLVTDEGVLAIKDCERLVNLHLVKTRVTPKTLETLKNALPQCRIQWDGGVIEADTSAARGVANAFIRVRGSVRLNGKDVEYKEIAALPREPFQVTGVNLSGTRVGDGELNQESGWKGVKSLNLRDTKVTNEGLKYLKPCEDLTSLDLRSTIVTKDGVAELAKALPNCRIEWDGGVIEPKK